MAKGDSGKAQKMIDTQGPLAQNYLTQQQQQINNAQVESQKYMYGSGTNTAPDQSMVMEYIQKRQSELPPTKDSLQTIVQELNAQGIDAKFASRAGGLQSDDKIVLPGGTMVDMISDVNGPGAGWTANYVEGPSGYGLEGNQGAAGQALKDYGNIMGQYGEFAKTGGFSPEDLANIRSRSVSPIRSVYSSAREGVERNKALQGGYSPNYNAAMAKLGREQAYATSDASTNVEAGIAEMVQRGKLAGLGGMSGMYGSTPGLANMFGNQALQNAQLGLTASGLQNQLGLGLIGRQIEKSGVPSTYQQALGNIGGTIGLIGKIGGAVSGVGF